MFSAKNKIRLILGLIAVISWGSTLLSLLAINRMIFKVDLIVSKDVAITELGDRITIRMLEARRDEKNFIIYSDSTYLVQNRARIQEIIKDIQKTRVLTGIYQQPLDSLEILIRHYASAIAELSRTYQEDPRSLYKLQEQIQLYEQELRRMAKKRELNMQEMSSLGADLSMPILSAAMKISADQVRLFNDLRETSDQVQQLVQRISQKARDTLAADAAQSMQYGLTAQKWIFILLIVTGILLLALIIIIPNRIFLRFNRLNRILKAIGRGETDFAVPKSQYRDEVDELFESFGDAIERLKYFNNLKTEKIIEIERNLRRIIDEVDEAVFILSEDLKITHLNRAAQQMFNIKNEVIRNSIRSVSSIWEPLGEKLDQIEKIGRIETEIKLRKHRIKKQHVIVMPITGLANRLESVVVFIR